MKLTDPFIYKYISFHSFNTPVHSFVHPPTETSVRRVNTKKTQLKFPDL